MRPSGAADPPVELSDLVAFGGRLGGSSGIFPHESALDRSVVDTLQVIRSANVFEALRIVVAHQRIGGLVPHRDVGGVLVIMDDGLVEQVVAECLVALVLAVPALFDALIVAVGGGVASAACCAARRPIS